MKEPHKTPTNLLKKGPSLALKSAVLAAWISYALVALKEGVGCFTGHGECLLLSPAVLAYWVPAFFPTWLVTATILWMAKRTDRRG